ncbi:hypothetical protein [Rhodoferax sp.]|uniref:hypothetical protein n=1 Tax=Rhodoferax sp. TaxID=50421 RepID=UPI00283DC481|nr:hypothetical protein [Rhodoferax sp.]MDR3369020.1 hypothetical protein [Rhodoferax sp.]
MHDAQDLLWTKRRALRQQLRNVIRSPGTPEVHWACLLAAMEMAGSEPVQGVLADIFFAFDATETAFKRQALRVAANRLPAHIARWFEANSDQTRLPRITALATRWSALARPSVDMLTRSRRCSADDSRALAEQVVLAWTNDDVSAQQEFLHHCLICHDKLAFMLARRALLRSVNELPPNWSAVSLALEKAMEPS